VSDIRMENDIFHTLLIAPTCYLSIWFFNFFAILTYV